MTPVETCPSRPADLCELLANLAGVLEAEIGRHFDSDAAYEWLDLQISGVVCGIARRRGLGQYAEDALQDVLVQALLTSATYRPAGAKGARSFFRMVARRKTLSWANAQRQKGFTTGVDELLAALADRSGDVEGETDLRLDLADAVSRLGPGERATAGEVLGGASPADVAERTGMKPVTVRKRFHRARAALRDRLNRDTRS